MEILRLILVHFAIAAAMGAGFIVVPALVRAIKGLAFRPRFSYRGTFPTRPTRRPSRWSALGDLRDDPFAPFAG